jgi:hypothetical protein
VAHVRVAGEVGLSDDSEETAHFLEILDAARGPEKGQLIVLVTDNPRTVKAAFTCRPGEEFILFSRREPDGTYRPYGSPAAKWAAGSDGKPAAHPLAQPLFPVGVPDTLEQVITHLWNECRQRDFRVSVSVNTDDLRRFQPHRPLRVQIAIENTGGHALAINNSIEYEFYTPRRGELEKLEELQKSDDDAVDVELILQPLGRLRSLRDVAKSLRDSSREVALQPGERCEGDFDLAEEYDVCEGGPFAVWAEVGGQRSAAAFFELPIAEELGAEKMLEELTDGEGPLRKTPVAIRHAQTMPAVQPTLEADAIRVALEHWLTKMEKPEADAELERSAVEQPVNHVVLLALQYLSAEFSPRIDGHHIVLCDELDGHGGKPVLLRTTSGPAVFAWRQLTIENVRIDGQEATVEIREGSRRGGSGATYHLQRKNGKWQITQTPQRWIS